MQKLNPTWRPQNYAQNSKRIQRETGSGKHWGKGVITQWVHGEFIVSFETICPANTHQVCVEYF